MALQREFAQNGIRWKVEDAKRAGIHPLYALGANTTSYSPVSVGAVADTSLSSGMAAMGQDLGRAVNATRTGSERQTAVSETFTKLQIENQALQNEMLASQIAKLRASNNPPMPSLAEGQVPEGKLDPVTPLVAAGNKILQNRGWSDGSSFEDRWGEWGGSAAGLAVMAADLLKHSAAGRAALQRAYPINFRARGSLREKSRELLGRY